VLSLLEDLAAVALTVVAFALPVLAFVMVLGLVLVIVLAWRRTRRG
jgi:maltodextrin utilization protein YvdJ